MDESNVMNILEITGKPQHPKIIRLLELTEHKKDVPDPYYTGILKKPINWLQKAVSALLEKIRMEQNLT